MSDWEQRTYRLTQENASLRAALAQVRKERDATREALRVIRETADAPDGHAKWADLWEAVEKCSELADAALAEPPTAARLSPEGDDRG